MQGNSVSGNSAQPHWSNGGKWLTVAIVLPVFLLVLCITYFTPMHSDDYSYALRGVSLKSTIDQYKGWSGRLVADLLSSAVLGTGNHLFISLFNAVALVTMIGIIAAFPVQGTRRFPRLNPLAFLLIFLIYWIANPTLGQTTFWITGAANYLWTNVFHFLFLLLFLQEAKSVDHNSLKIATITLLALAAGCSNENTSITTLLLISLLTWRELKQGNKNWNLFIYVAAFAIGTTVLILAPGNTTRSGHFPEWSQMSLLEKTSRHLLERVPTALLRFGELIVFFLIALKFSGKLEKETRFYVLLFAGASLLSCIVFLPSPIMPKRSGNGAFIYLLISTSFLLYAQLGPERRHKIFIAFSLAIFGSWFAASYLLIFQAYRQAMHQAQVRNATIEQGVARGLTHIEIPQFYFSRLLKPKRDRLEAPFNAEAVSRYYKTSATINEYPVRSNYGPGVAPTRK